MLRFGEKNIIEFESYNSLYYTIGYLTNFSKRGTKISIESYDDKWGYEYRIWIKTIGNIPEDISRAISAGNNSYEARLNCNEFIIYLINEHDFDEGRVKNEDFIRETIPNQYRDDFERGYNS